jgi:hypothetical protein
MEEEDNDTRANAILYGKWINKIMYLDNNNSNN